MSEVDVDAAIRELRGSAQAQAFDPAELDGLPEPVRRYLGG